MKAFASTLTDFALLMVGLCAVAGMLLAPMYWGIYCRVHHDNKIQEESIDTELALE